MSTEDFLESMSSRGIGSHWVSTSLQTTTVRLPNCIVYDNIRVISLSFAGLRLMIEVELGNLHFIPIHSR